MLNGLTKLLFLWANTAKTQISTKNEQKIHICDIKQYLKKFFFGFLYAYQVHCFLYLIDHFSCKVRSFFVISVGFATISRVFITWSSNQGGDIMGKLEERRD